MELSQNTQDCITSEILRAPDSYSIYLDGKVISHARGKAHGDIFIRFEEDAVSGGLTVILHATKADLYHLRLRWNFRDEEKLSAENGFTSVRVYSEDRHGGDFHGIDPDRMMPWFFTVSSGSDLSKDNSGRTSVGYGAMPTAAAHCAWQLDHLGVTLWLDMRSAHMPLSLKSRAIRAATVKRLSFRDISAFEATKAFCAELMQARAPKERIFGTRLPLYTHGEDNETMLSKAANNALFLETVSKKIERPIHLIIDIIDDRADCSDTELHTLAEAISKNGVLPAILFHPRADENIRFVKTRSGKAIPDISDPKTTNTICDRIRSVIRMGFRMIALDYDDFDIYGRCESFAHTMHLPRDDEKLTNHHHTSAEIISSFYREVRTAITAEEEIFGYKIPLFIFGAVMHLCTAADYVAVQSTESSHYPVKALYESAGALIPALIKGGHSLGYAAYMPISAPSARLKNMHNILTHLSKSGLSFIVTFDAESSSGTEAYYLKEYFQNASNPPDPVYPIDITENRLPVIWRRGRKSVTLKLFGSDGYEYFGGWNF